MTYKIGPCGILKKTEKNKIRRCILTLSHFCIGKNQLLLVKYWLNLTKLEN